MRRALWLRATLIPPVFILVVAVVFRLCTANAYQLILGANIGVTAIAAVGLTLAIGGAGQLALGQAGFMAVGAYATALLTTRASMPFLLAVLVSVVMSGLLGAIVGYAALRLKGSYLAMASLAVGAAIFAILNADLSLGGANGLYGIPPIKIGSWDLLSPEQQYFFVAVVLVVVSALCALFIATRHGWELRAMRDDAVAAQLIGINVTVRKVEIFAISAALGGLAGSLSASMQGVIDPTQFAPSVSITLFVIVAIGGMGSITGAVFGSALVYYVTQEITGSGLYALAALGAIVILLMAFVPGGLASIPRRLAQSGLARRAYRGAPSLLTEGSQ